ncbi:NAD dependent epimerase/dehydratase family protein-like protein [Lineolata rhizophorae]|uniref:NAD dependent epimerase/dehydratase family protein-like protein n=1 Tax=Lineolata rhizophorae TaxID=578093 RepID=A0A6A6PDR5_9PEZI|nr:NAD dependent epimerase/dehydratase family protein-like protein [Lineolata rhizophorae]
MSLQTVQNRGIYRGLPTFPDHVKGLTAIITGANGISGQHMLRVLGQSPERWTKIYCLSRRPPMVPGGLPGNAEHVSLDFLKSPEEIAQTLKSKGVKADHIFFYSYIQVDPKPGQGLWSDAEEMTRVNVELLTNFLESLTLASIKPKRFMLQTGAKQYAIHLGPAEVPSFESDPRVTLESNFYYPQEDALFEWCRKQGVHWNVVRPSHIWGAVPDAAMNIGYPLAIYAAVQAKLGRKLEFPGDMVAWQNPVVQSNAMMNSYIEEWAVLTDAAADEAFNAHDGAEFSFSRLWAKMAEWYGTEAKHPDDNAKYMEMKSPYSPPPRGYGEPGLTRVSFTLAQWAKQPEVLQAWKEIAKEHDLMDKELHDQDRIFGFADGVSMRHPLLLSSAKLRKLGFLGYVDTIDSVREVFEHFAKFKMIPPIPN